MVLFLGKDMNWDLQNYHYYNAYAFLHHRLSVDMAPAQLQTFFNPLLDVPFYLMSQHFPSPLIGFVLGFVHGFNLSLVLVVFWKITRISHKRVKLIIGVVILAVSAIAPGFISELGGTMNDNVVSIFVLAALLLLIMASGYHENESIRRGRLVVCIAGFVMGIGVGLKPTISVYAISVAFSLVMLFDSWPERVRCFVNYGAAGMLGVIASAGFWWWELWSHFGNPFFPFLNNLFQSPYIQPHTFADKRFLPAHAWEYFIWPFIFSWNSERVAEVRFSDVRFALVCLFFIAFMLRGLFRSRAESPLIYTRPANFLFLFFALAFVLWMSTSSIYRYLISLELLVPIVLFALLERGVRSNKIRIAIAVAAVSVIFVMFRPLNWGRMAWSNPYISVDTGPYALEDDAVMVMLGSAPSAYVIPHLPQGIRYVRPGGNLRLREGDLFLDEIRHIVKEHNGPMYVLFDETYTSRQMQTALAQFKMDFRLGNCFHLKTNVPGRLIIFRLVPIS
jgi:hypothetical protein